VLNSVSVNVHSVDDMQPGSVLAGRYRVLRRLGEGGFATVALCSHLEIASLALAIKVLRAAHKSRARIIEGFRREAALLAMLRDRHTVRLVDYGLTDDGRTYIAMEYVRGIPLDRVIIEQGACTSADAARIGIGVLKSVVEAHSVGVIHQDIKPANIVMVRETGEPHAAPRVLDFGIARVLGEHDPAGEKARGAEGADTIFCTPAYAAPELLRGKPAYATDQYALGLVLAELVEGVPPFDFEGISASESPHLTRDPIPFGPKTLASPLYPVIARACEKRVRHRFATASEMLDELRATFDAMSPEERADSSVVVEEEEDIRDPIDKPAAATSQFVETQAMGIAFDDGDENEDETNPLRSFAPGDVVQSPLHSQARRAAMARGQEDNPFAAARNQETGGVSGLAPAESLPLPPVANLTPRPKSTDTQVTTPPSLIREPGELPVELPDPLLSLRPRAHTPAGEFRPLVRPARPSAQHRAKPRDISVNEAREVKLFGSSLRSTPVSWVGTIVVVAAIALPAIIAAWSVHYYSTRTDDTSHIVREVQEESPL
jgi:serine/threonine protein kinase